MTQMALLLRILRLAVSLQLGHRDPGMYLGDRSPKAVFMGYADLLFKTIRLRIALQNLACFMSI